MDVHVFTSLLCLTQLRLAQVCIPESLKDKTHHEDYEGYWGDMSDGNNVVSLLLLMQLICLSENYLCLISNFNRFCL